MSLSSAKAKLDAQGGDPATGYISKQDHKDSYTELLDDTALTGDTTAEAVTVSGALVAGTLSATALSTSLATTTYAAQQTITAKTDSYTLVTGDAGALVTVDKATGTNITVNGSLDLAAGQRIDLIQLGTGQVTVVASGATVNATPGLKLRAQYSAAALICVATDTYVLVGDLSA